MANSAPCGGDAFVPYGRIPMPAPANRTCEICGHATKEAAEAAHSAIFGLTTLPGPYGKCMGALGMRTVT